MIDRLLQCLPERRRIHQVSPDVWWEADWSLFFVSPLAAGEMVRRGCRRIRGQLFGLAASRRGVATAYAWQAAFAIAWAISKVYWLFSISSVLGLWFWWLAASHLILPQQPGRRRGE